MFVSDSTPVGRVSRKGLALGLFARGLGGPGCFPPTFSEALVPKGK